MWVGVERLTKLCVGKKGWPPNPQRMTATPPPTAPARTPDAPRPRTSSKASIHHPTQKKTDAAARPLAAATVLARLYGVRGYRGRESAANCANAHNFCVRTVRRKSRYALWHSKGFGSL